MWYFEDDSPEAQNYCQSVGRQVIGFNNTGGSNDTFSVPVSMSRHSLMESEPLPNARRKRMVTARPSGSLAVVSGHTL